MTLQEQITTSISENNLQFLLTLGDTYSGYVARGEAAEMYCVSADQIDRGLRQE